MHMQRDDQPAKITPLYRVFLFGQLRLERNAAEAAILEPRYMPFVPDIWDRRSPWRVLAYLLTCPGRQTYKDPFLDALWPEEGLERSRLALSIALSHVRHGLVDHQGQPLLTPRKADEQKLIRLADQESIWCDWDAFAECLRQAQAVERQGGDALALWEEAYALSQEEFLLEERYSDWCRGLRERTEGDQRMCVLRLAACYGKHGRSIDEERLLRQFLSDHPRDEDILCHLLETLDQQGRTQEALHWYQRTVEVLEEEGMEVAKQTREMAERASKNPAKEGIIKSTSFIVPDTSATEATLNTVLSDFLQAALQGIVGAVGKLEGATTLDPSRRRLIQQALPFLLSITGVMLDNPTVNFQLFTPDEVISFYSTAIPACWSLVYNGGIEYVEKVLPAYLAHLATFTQESSQYCKPAANLASQGYKLANLLDLRREDFGTALRQSKKALFYGQIAEDPNLQVGALIEEALTLWYRSHRKNPSPPLLVYSKALQLVEQAKNISPIIKARVHLGLAAAYAGLGQEQEALRAMGLAYSMFPEHPENDPHFSYTYYSHYYLYLYEGLMYVELGQPEKALNVYAHFHTPEYVSRRAEIANREATALLAAGDMEQCCARVETATTLAVAMTSNLRYSEAQGVYEKLQIRWPNEQKVKNLAELFQQ
jgi:DNA-binding SARP family transcriptional activator